MMLFCLLCLFLRYTSSQDVINCVILKEYLDTDCETPVLEDIPVRFYFLNPEVESILLVDAPDGGDRRVMSEDIEEGSFHEHYSINSTLVFSNEDQDYETCITYEDDVTYFDRYWSFEYSFYQFDSSSEVTAEFPFHARVKVTEYDSLNCFQGGDDYVTYYLPGYGIDTNHRICNYGLGGWFEVSCNSTKDGYVTMWDEVGDVEKRTYVSSCSEVEGLGNSRVYEIDPEDTFQGTIDERGFCSKIVCPNVCYGKGEDDPYVCSGHGNCAGYNNCECTDGYDFSQCQAIPDDDEDDLDEDSTIMLDVSWIFSILMTLL